MSFSVHLLCYSITYLKNSYSIPKISINVRCGEKDPKYYEFTWLKSSIYVLSSMTQRGWNTTPNSDAARISFFMYIKLQLHLLKYRFKRAGNRRGFLYRIFVNNPLGFILNKNLQAPNIYKFCIFTLLKEKIPRVLLEGRHY